MVVMTVDGVVTATGAEVVTGWSAKVDAGTRSNEAKIKRLNERM